MARIRVDVPIEVLCYTTQLRVRFSDVNLGKHVGNDAMARMFSDVRSDFWDAQGLPQLDPDDTTGLGLIVADVVMVYRAQAHLGDTLSFALGVHDVNRYGADVVARITRVADDTLIALGKSGFVYFDYGAGNVCEPPAEFTRRFGGAA